MNAQRTDKVDLASFSDEELEGLIPQIQKELETRRKKSRQEAYAKMREIAEEVGMTPEELLGIGGGAGRRRRGGGKGKRVKMIWQHPDDPEKVYKGGKKPDWLKELAEQGREPLKVEHL